MSRLSVAVGATAFSLLAAGCDQWLPQTSISCALRFEAHNDAGEALSGVDLRVNGQLSGQTDAHGVVEINVSGPAGARPAIELACPKGYRPLERQPEVVLRRLSAIDARAAALRFDVECVPEHRLAALIVHTSHADLPITIHGIERARTGADGIAHVMMPLDAKQDVHVQLDTSAHPELNPQNPVRVFHMADEDTFFVFDQSFQQPAPVRVRAPRRVRLPERPVAPPAPEAPYKLQ